MSDPPRPGIDDVQKSESASNVSMSSEFLTIFDDASGDDVPRGAEIIVLPIWGGNQVLGKARASYQGMITVAPDAQRTDAYQSNRTLLLSGDARGIERPWDNGVQYSGNCR